MNIPIKHQKMVEELCRFLEQSDPAPSLQELASKSQLSASYVQKLFKAIVGVSPKQYCLAHRRKTIKSLLKHQSIAHAIYASGHGSSSRFYEKSTALLGMKPKEYKAGGKDLPIMLAVGECSLGSVLVAQSEKGICAILLGNDPEKLVQEAQDLFPHAHFIAGNEEFEKTVAYVVGFIDQPQKEFRLPLDIRGTAFEQQVWQLLKDIPPGTTLSYSELARRLGLPHASRAVANACGANKLAVAIPCHRVIRKSGELSNYRWGIERKQQLIELEKNGIAVTK